MSEYTKGELCLSQDGLNILMKPTQETPTYIPIAKMKYEPWMDEDNDYPMDYKTATANARRICQCVNDHDSLKAKADSQPALLEACERALAYLGTSSKLDWDNVITPILEAAIEATKPKT